MLARALLITVAVLVLAWVGVLERDYRVGHAAGLRLFEPGKPSRAKVEKTADRLQSAGFLNPDTRWSVARTKYFLNNGYRRRAIRAAEAIVRREPANISGWFLLSQATTGRRSAHAVARIRRLDPLVGG